MKKKKPEIPYEVDEQIEYFKWAERESENIPELCLANGSLNGVRITIGQAMKMKRAGMKKGFPDIFLPAARAGSYGLFIELKRLKGGSLSTEQKEWREALEKSGYRVEVCKGFEAAKAATLEYLGVSG